MSEVQEFLCFNPDLAIINYSHHSRPTISHQEILERFSWDKLWFSTGEESSDSAEDSSCEGAIPAENEKPECDDVSETLANYESDDSATGSTKWVSLTTYSKKISLLDVTELFVSKASKRSYVIMRPAAKQRRKQILDHKQDVPNDDVSVSEQPHAEFQTPELESDKFSFPTPHPETLKTHVLLHKDIPNDGVSVSEQPHAEFQTPELESDKFFFPTPHPETLKTHVLLHKDVPNDDVSVSKQPHAEFQTPELESDKFSFPTPHPETLKTHVLLHKDVPNNDVSVSEQPHAEFQTPELESDKFFFPNPHPETLKTHVLLHKDVPNDDVSVSEQPHAEFQTPELESDNFSFPTPHPETLKTHVLLHEDAANDALTPVLKCNMCPFQTSHHGSLVSHKKIHKKEKSHLPCTMCKKRFQQPFKLTRHMGKEHGISPAICEECSLVTTQEKLELHKTTYHSMGKRHLPCTKCNKRFQLRINLIRHMRTMHGLIAVICEECSFMTTQENWELHRATHQTKILEIVWQSSSSAVLPETKRERRSRKQIIQPKEVPEMVTPVPPDMPETNIRDHTEIPKTHSDRTEIPRDSSGHTGLIETEHDHSVIADTTSNRDDAEIPEPKSDCVLMTESEHADCSSRVYSFTCKKCNIRFGKYFKLMDHLEFIHGINRKNCRKCECGFVSTNITEWKLHKKTHFEKGVCRRKRTSSTSGKPNSSSKTLTCALCNFRAKYLSVLKLHTYKCHGKKFECYHCDYLTRKKRALRTHISVVHLRKRKGYQCTECDLMTVNASYLKRHYYAKHSG